MRTKISPSFDHPPRGRVAVTVVAAATHTMRKVMASPASPFAISDASGIGIPKVAAALPVGWRGNLARSQSRPPCTRRPRAYGSTRFPWLIVGVR